MDLKSFGGILEQILCSTLDQFTLKRIVDELRDDYLIDAHEMAEKFGRRNFKELIQDVAFGEIVEWKKDAESGQLFYRGKTTANNRHIREAMMESNEHRLQKMEKKIHHMEVAKGNFEKAFDNFRENVFGALERDFAMLHAQNEELKAQLERQEKEHTQQIRELKQQVATMSSKESMTVHAAGPLPKKRRIVNQDAAAAAAVDAHPIRYFS